ncbi:MAG: DEAD/DEAH box helicase family protein [Deltaproteobacteria bacterium]|nr:DEAD/DEAH box helicase family protein [Deltaproteobacteria bacterium]
MKQAVIENPILNSPFKEPDRHFRFTDEGITNEIVDGRRNSTYFVPIPQPKRGKKQLSLDTQWTADRIEENKLVNRIRPQIYKWRQGGYIGVTRTTARLLEYWNDPERSKRLFFCQIEALETAIYITEVASKYDPWIENELRHASEEANPLLFRIAFKMATGSGKTVVMAMLIAWQALNKITNSQDARFSDAFLLVAPGITIRDRLRVLLPSEPDNYYRERDICQPEDRAQLQKAKIVITNYHTFKRREIGDVSKLGKAILKSEAFTETPAQMVRRVCRELGNKKNLIVINDEAHHCYRENVAVAEEALSGEDRRDAEERAEAARIWISGLEAVKQKLGVRAVYDLSATPFFLRGSGYPEGTLFPWVVSDFSLIDAIESGIVKIPRVPVADDSMVGEQPTYRDLWLHIRENQLLPKKGRAETERKGAPELPMGLEGAIRSLYDHYKKYYETWEQDKQAQLAGRTPPVFIVVCANTAISKLVYDYISGWDTGKTTPAGSPIWADGALPLFSNTKDGQPGGHQNTILVDSSQLESGEPLKDDFKKLAAREIEDFKHEYARRHHQNAEDVTDGDILREVMNTVGKPGKLGEKVRCVVSVSMLTEGWDTNTVTHILGVRAFSTQLLCEQVVGRGLRRMSYAENTEGKFEPEYAEVYGVPFSFIPTVAKPALSLMLKRTRVHAIEDRREQCEITFPRLEGYRYDLPGEKLTARFDEKARMSVSTQDVPSFTEVQPIVGEGSVHTQEDLKSRREQEVAFLLAKLVLEKYFRQDGEIQKDRPAEHRFDSSVQAWLFPQVLRIARQWMEQCLQLKDDTFPQLLLLIQLAHEASDKIYGAIVRSADGEKRIVPRLKPFDTVGSTAIVDFDTSKEVWTTDPAKCHVSHVSADSGWEQKMAQSLETMDEVVSYVKNQGLNFTIPYLINGQEKNYVPDFIVRIRDEAGIEPLNLIVEVTGQNKKDKEQKVATARDLWIPAVNNHDGFGRWGFIEIRDPWNAKTEIREFLQRYQGAGVAA